MKTVELNHFCFLSFPNIPKMSEQFLWYLHRIENSSYVSLSPLFLISFGSPKKSVILNFESVAQLSQRANYAQHLLLLQPLIFDVDKGYLSSWSTFTCCCRSQYQLGFPLNIETYCNWEDEKREEIFCDFGTTAEILYRPHW